MPGSAREVFNAEEEGVDLFGYQSQKNLME